MTHAPGIIVQLIHIHGSLKGEINEYSDEIITVGRVPTSTVKFPADEPGVSREHARIQRDGNQYKLVDISKFGTSVNGKKVKEAFLKNGDVVEFGPGGPKVSFNMEFASVLQQPPLAPVLEARPSPPIRESEQLHGVHPGSFPQPPPEAVNSYAAGTGAVPEAPPRLAKNKTSAPLIIQFGPTIQTYRELPVILGAGAKTDFLLTQPGVSDQHAQLFFYQNTYWIEDLTGQSLVSINNRPIGVQSQLSPQDEIELCPRGPKFRFLGGGRLAEIEASVEQPADKDLRADNAPPEPAENIFSRLMKGIRK